MPAINGLKCLKILKETPPLKNIPVYIYSISRVTDKEKSIALELGAVKWLTKPVDLKDYMKIFSEVFESSLPI